MSAKTVTAMRTAGTSAVAVDAIATRNAPTAAPDFREYLYKEGSEYVGSTPDQFAGFLRHEVQKNAELVKSAGLKPQ